MSQTLDKMIAANVKRLRLGPNPDNPKYSVAELAEKLDVGRHAVYDYERPRRGKQHSFTWSELVALCAVLECSIYELVFPDEGEELDIPARVAHGGLLDPDQIVLDEDTPLKHLAHLTDVAELEGVDPADVDIDSGDLAIVSVVPPGREQLAQVVFHLPWETVAAVIAGPIAKESDNWRNSFREAEEAAKRKAREAWQRSFASTLFSALADAEEEGDTE